MNKKVLAIILLIYSVFGGGLLDLLDKPTPEPTPSVEILDIDKPSKEVQENVQVFSDLITDPSDRAKIAIFNYEFANRVLSYDAEVQQVNDVYALAGKTFFKGSLVDKYENLAEEIVNLMEKTMGMENHILTQEEKQSVHNNFMGVAWILIQKG
jgi:hypothetical protein